MKNLSFLLVIVMLAGVVNAAVMNISVNDNPWSGELVMPSDMITMTFHGDVGGIGGFGALEVTVSCGDAVGDPIDLYGNWMMIPFSYTVTPTGSCGFVTTISGSNLTMPTPAGDYWEQTFHVPNSIDAGDTIVISHTAGDWNGIYPPPVGAGAFEDVVLHTPEPTTIGLLGLCALGLLRHRHK